MTVRVAGVDLAAEAAGTALAVLRVESGQVTLEQLQLGVDDETIVGTTRNVSLIGIDCAFGWPVDFVDFVARHAAGGELSGSDAGDLAWRRRLAHRETDRVVTERTGARPLSVATDRLGMTALRCAVLLDRLAGDGRVVDRSGEHPSAVAEVYPAMALRVWGLSRPGYKQSTDARAALIADLRRAAPWLELGDHEPLMRASADALDAVLAALVALAHARGASIRPTPDQRERARVEGWISIPTVGLSELGAIP
ncbi:MAG: hypothetical protein RLZZ608_864 [Actinomycetota bacterium]|jgi:predicted nuclease with RNAse H fold